MVKGHLFQEDLCGEPFWMLVCCILVNRTKWQQAEPVYEELRRRWPTPHDLANSDWGKIALTIKSLGLYNRRAASIGRLATMWVHSPPTRAGEVTRLSGCGQYAADSWAIFVDRRREFPPSHLATMDVELRTWLEDGGYVDQSGVHSGRGVI